MLSYQGVDPAEVFGGKTKKKQLADNMKSDFVLVKKLHKYSIHSIMDQVVQFSIDLGLQGHEEVSHGQGSDASNFSCGPL